MENNNDANNKVGDKSLRAIGKGIEIAGGTNYGATGTATGYSVPDTSGGDRHEAVSTRTQIELVVHSLGFTKKQLEEVLGVPRQEIYDWVKGDNVRDETSGRLSKLAHLIAKIPAEQRRPLHHRFTTLPLAEGESSLLDMLCAKEWDEDRILNQLRRAGELTARQVNRKKTDRIERSVEKSDEILLDNLLSLGLK